MSTRHTGRVSLKGAINRELRGVRGFKVTVHVPSGQALESRIRKSIALQQLPHRFPRGPTPLRPARRRPRQLPQAAAPPRSRRRPCRRQTAPLRHRGGCESACDARREEAVRSGPVGQCAVSTCFAGTYLHWSWHARALRFAAAVRPRPCRDQRQCHSHWQCCTKSDSGGRGESRRVAAKCSTGVDVVGRGGSCVLPHTG